MRRYKGIKIVCFLLTILSIATSMPAISPVYADNPKPVKISRTVSTTETDIGRNFTVNYHITGDKIRVPKPKKEIAVIVDCSLSMMYGVNGKSTTDQSKTRMSIAKTAAKNFITHFNNTKTKIIVVPYGDYAGSAKPISGFYSMTDAASLNSLRSYVDTLNTQGSTNTGDALRVAYYKLKNEGEAGARKYIVLMTDGEPRGYTYKSEGRNNKVYYLEAGLVNNSTILTDLSLSSSNDIFTKGHVYAKAVGESIKAANPVSNKVYNTFIIGFAQNDTSYDSNDHSGLTREQRMDQIGASAGADPVPTNGGLHFYKAPTEADLNSAYDAIQNLIDDVIPFSFMVFTDVLPAGVDIDNQTRQILIDKGFSIQEITYQGENRVQISVPLDTTLKRIAAESTADYDVYRIDDTDISFQIQVLATTDGMKLFEKNVTEIDYTYSLPDGTVISETAYNTVEQNVEVNLLDTVITMLQDTTLLVGSSRTLTATVNNPDVNRVAEWTASIPGKISIIDNGNNSAVITGTEVGSTVLTARTRSINGWYREATADCNVNVVDVSLKDMHVLQGTADGIPLALKVDNLSPAPVDVQITGWSVERAHDGEGNSEEAPFIQVDTANKRIKGLKGTGDTPVELSLTVNVAGQEKTLSAKVYVLDADIPETVDVLVFQTKQFDVAYSVPDDSYKSRLAISGDYIDGTDSQYATFDDSNPSRWTVNGISLKDQGNTPVEINVTVDYAGDGDSPAQHRTVTRTITVRKPAVDIN